MLLFNPVGFSFLSHHVRIHLIAVGVVIGQRAVDLCQGEMRIFSRDFLRGQAELVSSHDGSNGHASPGNMRCAALNARRAGDHAADFNFGRRNAHVKKMLDSIRRVNSG